MLRQMDSALYSGKELRSEFVRSPDSLNPRDSGVPMNLAVLGPLSLSVRELPMMPLRAMLEKWQVQWDGKLGVKAVQVPDTVNCR